MGDFEPTPSHRRPGIAIVRPRLHSDTPENRALFRRWTKFHMRDTLSLPKHEELGRASKVLRYTRTNPDGGEEYFYTIVLDDIRLPGTETFQKVPQRLDLENTRDLEEGEEPVLREGDERAGAQPMVFGIVKPVVGIFEKIENEKLDQAQSEFYASYQDMPAEVATLQNASRCRLVTLTLSCHEFGNKSVQAIERIHSSLVSYLAKATQTRLYTTLYNHSVDAQPGGLPNIAEGEHGRGDWVACVLVGGIAHGRPSEERLGQLDTQVQDWLKRSKLEGQMEGLNFKAAVWKGDVFMSSSEGCPPKALFSS